MPCHSSPPFRVEKSRAPAPHDAHPLRQRLLTASTILIPLAVLLDLVAGGTLGRAVPGGPPAPISEAKAETSALVPSAQQNVKTLINTLLRQADFWQSQNQPQRALESLRQALRADPDNPDVLARAAELAATQGDGAYAASLAERLRRVAPTDPRLAHIATLAHNGPIQQDDLATARNLAQQGQAMEAVQAYRRLFHGDRPPPQYAREYYQTLAATNGGWEQARSGLADLVRAQPDNLQTQLAYAELLTYRQGASRLDGITRLERLAQDGPVAAQATKLWRQSLGWLPEAAESIPQLEAFLKLHPDDTGIRARLDKAKMPASSVDVAGQSRADGFTALNRNHLNEAASLFGKAIAANGNDADAVGGLGLVRLRQHNFSEAAALLARAVVLDPGHRERWEAALTAARNPGGGPNPAQAMIDRNNLAGAEAELRQQIANGRNGVWPYVMLADVYARQGRLAEAEVRYRDALARAPANASALVGLAGVLGREGKSAEAADLLVQAQANGSSARAVGQARAQMLREQAERISDPATREALYRTAATADSSNPWIQLDLARSLVAQGRVYAAQVVMARAVAGQASAEALRAGIIFARETHDAGAIAALISRLPMREVTPDMRAFQQDAATQREIRAAMMLPGPMARERLLAMARDSATDPLGLRGSAIAMALNQLGDNAAARSALALAQNATRPLMPTAQLAYARTALDLGDTSRAASLLEGVDGGRLPSDQREALTQLQVGVAIKTSDTYNEQGRQASAYDYLAPALARQPDNPDLNMALGRLYEGADKPRQALVIAEALLNRDPSSIKARQAAASAALKLGERNRAAQFVEDGLQIAPNDPAAWVAAAEIHQAMGENGRALREFQRARVLRMQQIGEAPGPDESGTDGSDRVVLVQQYSEDEDTSPSYPPSPFARPAATQRIAANSTPRVASAGADQSGDTGPFGHFSAGNDTRFLAAPAASAYAGSANPFRPAAVRAADLPDLATPEASSDPMLATIDSRIDELQIATAPSVQAGVGFRTRSGDSGLDKLYQMTMPMTATWAPTGTGRLSVTATPTLLSSGRLSGSTLDQQRFGTGALSLSPGSNSWSPSFFGSAPGDQSASGVGLNLAYQWDPLKLDVGSTPLGFTRRNILGGVEWAPHLTNRTVLRLTLERRTKDDSLLSYAGTRDPGTGIRWGGVTRSGGHANLEFDLGGGVNAYAGGGGQYLNGSNVQDNTEIDAGAGGSFRLMRTETGNVRVGTDLVYFGYKNNLRFFTLGQGGYFSPQSYFAALFPITYKAEPNPDLTYEISFAPGLQIYHENASRVYPTRSDLQSQLESMVAAGNIAGLISSYPSRSESGFSGKARGTFDYRINKNLHVGGELAYQHAGNFDEATGMLFVRYLFSGLNR